MPAGVGYGKGEGGNYQASMKTKMQRMMTPVTKNRGKSNEKKSLLGDYMAQMKMMSRG